MYIMTISTISDPDQFWESLKKAYSQLPSGAKWILAVGSTDRTRGVNIIVSGSLDSVKRLFEQHASPFATTEYFEADAASAVGLGKK